MNILDVPMRENSSGADTVGGYLRRLLIEVWREGEGFSGKRAFGDSGWQFEVYEALAEAGVIEGEGTLYYEGTDDEFTDWDVDFGERARADQMIYQVIKEKLQ